MPLETRMRSTVSSMLSPMKKIRAATKGRGPQMRQRLAVPSAESSAEDNNTQFKGQKAAYWSNEPKFSKSSAEDNNTIFKGNQKAVYWSNESKCSKSSAEENNT